MPALWIGHVSVTDPEAYGKYANLQGQQLQNTVVVLLQGRGVTCSLREKIVPATWSLSLTV